MEKLAGPRLVDLCWHLPVGIIDRRLRPSVAEARDGTIATMTAEVLQHQPPRNPRLPYRVVCADASGTLTLVFFHAQEEYLTRLLPVGERRVVSGRIQYFNDQVQMAHPDHVVRPEELDSLPPVEPVYRLTSGLTPKPLQRAVRSALDAAPELPEWQDAAWLRARRWAGWARGASAGARAGFGGRFGAGDAGT